jgi:hypothetical protein
MREAGKNFEFEKMAWLHDSIKELRGWRSFSIDELFSPSRATRRPETPSHHCG